MIQATWTPGSLLFTGGLAIMAWYLWREGADSRFARIIAVTLWLWVFFRVLGTVTFLLAYLAAQG